MEVVIDGRNLTGKSKSGRIVSSVMPEGTDVVTVLDANDVRIIASPEESNMPGLFSILLSWFPMLLFIGVWIYSSDVMPISNHKRLIFMFPQKTTHNS